MWITSNKRAYAIGFNSGNKISSTIPTGKHDKEIEIKIFDKNNRQCSFLSAVCGTYYTLYLTMSPISTTPKLAFVFQGEDNGNPLFLNIGDSVPIALYGGRRTAATINKNGSILILTEIVFKSPLSLISPSFLPNSEKAICVGCCDSYVIALSSKGTVYESQNINDGKTPTFSIVPELSRYKIIDVSGAHNHCFAVRNDGVVFTKGVNDFGQLGVGKEIKKTDRFIEVNSLKGQNIVHASAGRFHSLFMTLEGKIFGCGRDTSGSLLLKTGNSSNSVFYPVESSITTGASYCFAGNSLSTVIIGPTIPPYLPNRNIGQLTNPANDMSDLMRRIQSKDQEIAKLKQQNELQKLKIDEIQSKNLEIAKLKQQNELQKMKLNEFQLKDQEIAKLKQQNEVQKKKIKELQKKLDENANYSSKLSNKSHDQSKGLNFIDTKELDKIKKIGKIGRGAMAKVIKVAREEYYAMKIIDIEFCQKDTNTDDADDDNFNIDFEKIKRFFQEYEIMNNLNHPNIIKAFGFCFGDSKHKPSILLEFCPFNLKKCIKTLNDNQRIAVIIEISDAMKHVHKAGIIHRDLKLENILLDAEMHVKLSDFGISTLIKLESESMNRTQMSGTLPFMAPELILGHTNYNEKVDIYAFGVVLYLILNEGEYPKISIGDVANGKMAQIPQKITSYSQTLIKKCWAFQASERPTFDEINQSLKSNINKIV